MLKKLLHFYRVRGACIQFRSDKKKREGNVKALLAAGTLRISDAEFERESLLKQEDQSWHASHFCLTQSGHMLYHRQQASHLALKKSSTKTNGLARASVRPSGCACGSFARERKGRIVASLLTCQPQPPKAAASGDGRDGRYFRRDMDEMR